MYKIVLVSLFGFMIAVKAAPTSLKGTTLLQNGEEAQALNRYFKSLKAADPCNDGQVACIGGRTLAKCQGTAWTITLSKCSGSQSCYALPSVLSSGTRITCSSEKNAEGLISAAGAVGGIYGHAANGGMEVLNQGSTHRGSDGATTGTESPAILIQPTPATKPTVSDEQNIPFFSPDGEQRVPVTMTLVPPQIVITPPETETISPEEASAFIKSAVANPTITINRAFVPPLTTQGGADDYVEYDDRLLYL